MGCNASHEVIENKKIEQWQLAAAKDKERTINLLLIGSGDSGKTTLRKQITNVHNEAFADPEFRKTFISVIADNLVDGTVTVLNSLKGSGIFGSIELLVQERKACESHITERMAGLINDLQKDPNFQDSIHRRTGEIHLQECYPFFLEKLKSYPAWGGPEWVPSIDECIRARTRTSGIVKENCVINSVDFCIIDVGGQRAERRKWLHVFDDVTAAIFVAALSDYDQVLFEDNSKNRLEEALDLFSECVNSQWLYDIPTLLFLNKQDVFERRYLEERIPLNVSGKFPAAPAGFDRDLAFKWFGAEFIARKSKYRRMILGENKSEPSEGPETFVHFTTATDPQNVKKVFKVSADIIAKANLRRAGFGV